MKTIFRLICGLMAIALTTACTNEELLQTETLQQPATGKVISVKAYTPGEQPATRLAFKDKGEEGLKLSWSEGDAFTAVIGNEKVTFTYNAQSKEFTADVAENIELIDGIKAYYPAYTDEYEKDFSTQTGALNSTTTYMEGEYEGNAFKFTHSTAILKVEFTGLPDDAEISSITISGAVDIHIANYNSSAAAYINLPAIAKDSQMKFLVETTAGIIYTSTQTVKIESGIQVGTFYTAPITLTTATVCNLPAGSEFKSAVKTLLDSNSSLTQIEFIANSSTTGTQIGSSTAYLVAGSDNTLEIHTNANVFVFNANCYTMFNALIDITTIDFNNCINTAKVTNMSSMFSFCSALTSLDVSSFNTSKVTNMSNMFSNCYALTSLDLSSFVFSAVSYFTNMFTNLGKDATSKPIPVYVKDEATQTSLKGKDTNINSEYAEIKVKP